MASSSLTVFSGAIVSNLGWPSLSLPMGTVTFPLSSTWISEFLKAKSGLAALTASRTAFFSASVRWFLSETSVNSLGSFNVFPVLSKSLMVCSGARVPFLSPSVTVTLPLASTFTTALSLSLVLLASLTASATLSLSVLVKLLTSLTSTLSVGASSLRTLLSSTTVSLAGTSPTLPPLLMVTLPSGSTVISSLVKCKSGLASIMASLTLSFSPSSSAFAFLTSTGFSGGLILFKTSFWVTVWSAGISPVLSPLVTVTLPSLPTVISSFVRFLSWLASITASLTLVFSPSVKSVLSWTGTFLAGAVKSSLSSVSFTQTA